MSEQKLAAIVEVVVMALEGEGVSVAVLRIDWALGSD